MKPNLPFKLLSSKFTIYGIAKLTAMPKVASVALVKVVYAVGVAPGLMSHRTGRKQHAPNGTKVDGRVDDCARGLRSLSCTCRYDIHAANQEQERGQARYAGGQKGAGNGNCNKV